MRPFREGAGADEVNHFNDLDEEVEKICKTAV